ncbi:MAG: periplasmic heavy metal sensor [Rhizobiales bacterium]|nr:periplasmic heavy metal sensor [Hyphomicrobiales bacterium]
MKFMIGLVMAFALLSSAVSASDAPYAGQDRRDVSSFSEADVAELLAGAGWGLAKPAELNGWPGPRHVLDLTDKLALAPEQAAKIQTIFEAMNAEARALGAELIAHEQALDAAFESGEIDADRLRAFLSESETVRTKLRQVHLEAHLLTTPILNRHQKMTYRRLRGYSADGHNGHH